jgi:hypothetical protein
VLGPAGVGGDEAAAAAGKFVRLAVDPATDRVDR